MRPERRPCRCHRARRRSPPRPSGCAAGSSAARDARRTAEARFAPIRPRAPRSRTRRGHGGAAPLELLHVGDVHDAGRPFRELVPGRRARRRPRAPTDDRPARPRAPTSGRARRRRHAGAGCWRRSGAARRRARRARRRLRRSCGRARARGGRGSPRRRPRTPPPSPRLTGRRSRCRRARRRSPPPSPRDAAASPSGRGRS